ncbi:MAG TPA: hypothetical protein GX531_04915 [Methanothermobacter sp.]|nr:hypothetical protein [Methanothermobacter sp.]
MRIGFNIIDLSSGLKGVLATVNNINEPIMAKYKFNLKDIHKITILSITL